jgi:AcrR family transcriptional regulator
MHSPFLRPDATGAAEIIADCAVRLLVDHGVARLSAAAIARSMGVTPQALCQQVRGKARVMELLLISFGPRWLAWSGLPERNSDLPARLPVDEDELHGVRVWQALRELARGELAAGDPALQRHVTRIRAEERAMLGYRLRGLLDRQALVEELDATGALVDGLRAAVVEPEPQFGPDRARVLLANHVRTLRAASAGQAA